ncbi:hypothetical protein U8335_03995 [Roseiconus lacunae]|uniref:Pectate lyase superfamily protein domain-containing protein n=1 Tax=Roseiconus lacunae TaxID=2605694 RepID=A0ABT7PHJ9_9BACT|nr:hypothetical protein [Roseiconus lacunae]MDM4015967.1 hypothetical protein [Roseiconus lacunae]WRQ51704.1 hypothetical protein U8335_03995 [Stieleria sp. HD01]
MGNAVPYTLDRQRFVATYSQLGALRAIDGDLVQVGGYYANGDGGGQVLHYSAESTANVDGGFVFPGYGGTLEFDGLTFDGESGTGRWIARETQTANGRRFGMHPDLPRNNGPLYRCLQAINSHGASVYIPRGVYICFADGLTNIAAEADVHIYGDGKATLLKHADGSVDTRYDSIFYLTNAVPDLDFHIHDLGFDGNMRNQSGTVQGDPSTYEHSHSLAIVASGDPTADPSTGGIRRVQVNGVYGTDPVGDTVLVGGSYVREVILFDFDCPRPCNGRNNISVTCNHRRLACSRLDIVNFDVEVNTADFDWPAEQSLTDCNIKYKYNVENNAAGSLRATNVKVGSKDEGGIIYFHGGDQTHIACEYNGQEADFRKMYDAPYRSEFQFTDCRIVAAADCTQSSLLLFAVNNIPDVIEFNRVTFENYAPILTAAVDESSNSSDLRTLTLNGCRFPNVGNGFTYGVRSRSGVTVITNCVAEFPLLYLFNLYSYTRDAPTINAIELHANRMLDASSAVLRADTSVNYPLTVRSSGNYAAGGIEKLYTFVGNNRMDRIKPPRDRSGSALNLYVDVIECDHVQHDFSSGPPAAGTFFKGQTGTNTADGSLWVCSESNVTGGDWSAA